MPEPTVEQPQSNSIEFSNITLSEGKLNLVNKLLDCFEVNNNPESIKQFTEAINQGEIPIIASNHLSLVDVFAMIKIAQEIKPLITNKNFQGFLLPYDINDPGQSTKIVQEIFPCIQTLCKQNNIHLLPIIKSVNYTSGNTPEEEKKFHDSLSTITKLYNQTNSKKSPFYGLAIFPEGNTNGSFLGFRVGKKSMIDNLSSYYRRKKIKFKTLPIGIIGSQNIFNPNTFELNIKPTVTINIGEVLPNPLSTYAVDKNIASLIK